jgi:hypothetical protein
MKSSEAKLKSNGDKASSCFGPLLTYLLTYLLTPWCRILFEKLIVTQFVRKYPAFLRNPKVHHRVHKSPPLDPILSQPNPVRPIDPYLPKTSHHVIFLQPPVTSSLLGTNILLNNLFSNILNLYSSLKVTDQVLHPYKATNKIKVQYILIYTFFRVETGRQKF